MEMATNLHGCQHIKMLVVDDDCAIDNVPHSIGRRGLAGVCFIHKIAGAMSAKGCSLDETFNLCQGILERREIRTIGFVCCHEAHANRLDNIEIGFGIHGEPGSISLSAQTNFNRILAIMDEKLLLKGLQGRDVAILVNNLGGMSEFLFNQFMYEFLTLIGAVRGVNVRKMYAGKYVTSLKREGLSVSLMELNDARLMEFLEMPVDTPIGGLFIGVDVSSLSQMRDGSAIAVNSIPKSLMEQMRSLSHCCEPMTTTTTAEQVDMIRNAILNSIDAVRKMKDHLDQIDSELGDGDTGSTVSRAVTVLEGELNSGALKLTNPKQMLSQISNILMNGMGGTSGAIFSIFFQCAAKAFTSEQHHSSGNWTRAIGFGIEGIMKHGKAKVGDRSLLDALNAGLDAINSRESTELSALVFLRCFADGCAAGAEATKNMRPKIGRSCYSTSDQSEEFEFRSDSPDPGALAVAIIAQSLADSISSMHM